MSIQLSDDRRSYIYQTARTCGYRIRKSFARELRKNLTPAEAHFWNLIRLDSAQKTGGSSWRRQHIIDRFIVDFAHLGHGLVVELDGGYHNTQLQQTLDQDRDAYLVMHGWQVIRLDNAEVLAVDVGQGEDICIASLLDRP